MLTIYNSHHMHVIVLQQDMFFLCVTLMLKCQRCETLKQVQKGIFRLVDPWLISNLMHKILIYLHIIHLLKSCTCFEHYPAHLQEVYVIIVYMQPLVSSLSAGDCLVHRLRKNRCTRHHRVTIPEAAYIQL